METKFKPGQVVTHPLGFKCMVETAYASGMKTVKAEDGTETQEEVQFDEPIYELQYFTQSLGIQKTRLSEKYIPE